MNLNTITFMVTNFFLGDLDSPRKVNLDIFLNFCTFASSEALYTFVSQYLGTLLQYPITLGS